MPSSAEASSPPVRFGPDGLAPAVIQDVTDGRVLMVGYMDAEALAATLDTGEVHFHSRSRDRLWRKGETSGNVLRLAGLSLDCDGDALLLAVDPVGPTCHRGTRSCFDELGEDTRVADAQGFVWLEHLWATIDDRARRRPQGSYTASLLEGGPQVVGRKVTEEATEVLIAAMDDAFGSRAARSAVVEEVADLLYHTIVLLAERGVAPREVIGALRSRMVAETGEA